METIVSFFFCRAQISGSLATTERKTFKRKNKNTHYCYLVHYWHQTFYLRQHFKTCFKFLTLQQVKVILVLYSDSDRFKFH